jgi:hypothetical protein
MKLTEKFWNSNLQPGTPVAYFYHAHRPDYVDSVTTGQAFKQEGFVVVTIEGVEGAVRLDHLAVPGVTPIPPVTLPRLCERHKPLAKKYGIRELEAKAEVLRKSHIQNKCSACGAWLFPCEE